MAEVEPPVETSPRSILAGSDMTSNVGTMNESNKDGTGDLSKVAENCATEIANNDARKTAATPTGDTNKEEPSPESPENKATRSTTDGDKKGVESPQPQASAQLQYPSHLTPQSAVGYYFGYAAQPQQIPEPPSPGGPAGTNSVCYDVGSFFQQPGAGTFAPHNSPFQGPNTPLSPPRPTAAMAMVPPASPLFPRMNSSGSDRGGGGAPPSPSLPYMSPPLSGVYQPYPANSQSSNSPEEGSAWTERNQQQNVFHQNSPQLSAQQGIPYGVPMSRASVGGRTYSFEENMLPPSALNDQDQANPAYSPYGGSQTSSGGTLFAHQQPWGYGGPAEMYGNTPGSPLQPRPTVHPQMQMPYSGPMGGGGGGGGGMRQMGPYGQYYPASSPGPPIQTTASNKGPDGANLFIFHIPNHFTNLDMYQLFCAYGNLLSVRIMVEKDTGRSRGFGFVSYDNPESAAMAIKELNGFAIGNKRLKVQHKQIRPKDFQDRDNTRQQGGYGSSEGTNNNNNYPRSQFGPSLPPSGPTAPSQNLWYDAATRKTPPDVVVEEPPDGGKHHHQDEGTEMTTSTSTAGETPLGLSSTTTNTTTNESSPLASLGQLQSSLPEVPGNSTPEAGEPYLAS